MNQRLIIYIKICVALLLLGRGVLHFTEPQPYHFLFGPSELISIIFGVVLLIFGLLALSPALLMKRGWWIYLYILPSLILIIHSAAAYVKAGSVWEQFVEHCVQMALPIILIYVCKEERLSAKKLYYVLGVFVALAFIGHGAFALGLHYVPGNFVEMTTRSLLISNEAALAFLRVIGILDFVFAILIFLPFFRRYVIWYLIVWGILTSLARTYYMLDEGFTAQLFAVNVPNTIYRLPHGFVPLIMVVLAYKMEVKYRRKSGFAAI